MSKSSTEFEIFISKIHKLLERDSAQVTWNESIPDPDNPSQSRQIDIAIRKDGLFNIVECRLHQKKQDVKWIEELIGRKYSLGASSITAVSSSGFTVGAIKKAQKYGVILSELKDVSDEFIASWTRGMEIILSFVRYESFKINFIVDSDQLTTLDVTRFKNALLNHKSLLDMIKPGSDPFGDLNKNAGLPFSFECRSQIKNLFIDNILIDYFDTKGILHLETMGLTVPTHLAYVEPNEVVTSKSVIIQKYDLGNTSVIQHQGNVSLQLDLSKLQLPAYCQFCSVEMRASKNVDDVYCLRSFEMPIVDMYIDTIDVSINGEVI